MGCSLSSKIRNGFAWTDEEILENSSVEKLQKDSFDFLLKYIYKEIPIRFGKKSSDPASALWIEPSPTILSQREDHEVV
jgi:hypothetical protein